MKTPFDAISLVIFGVLAVVFLHRSAKPVTDTTPLWQYALVALACAGGDVAGNHGAAGPAALALLVAGSGAVWIALRGLGRSGDRR